MRKFVVACCRLLNLESLLSPYLFASLKNNFKDCIYCEDKTTSASPKAGSKVEVQVQAGEPGKKFLIFCLSRCIMTEAAVSPKLGREGGASMGR